jgi:hypothetical protein
LGSYFIDVALLLVVEVNANSVLFSAFQNETSIVGLTSIAFQPILDRELCMVGEPLCIVRGEVDDATGLVATLSTVRLA